MSDRIFITGASRGLGYELCKTYLEQGSAVYGGVRTVSAEKVAALGRRFPDRFTAVCVDVSDIDTVARAADTIARRTGAIDICINNAGIYPQGGKTLETVHWENALEMYNVNALGPLRVARCFAGLLRRGVQPVLANVSSEAGQIADNPRDKEFEYCMSKTALNQATALLARKLKPDGIRVLALHPGWIRTDMGGQDACGDPADAARGFATVIAAQRTRLDGPRFLDWRNNELRW